MDLPKVTINHNGHKASPDSGEAFPVASPQVPLSQLPLQEQPNNQYASRIHAQRTTFPSDPQSGSLRTFLHNASNHYIGGTTLFRYLLWIPVLLAIVWFSGLLPLRWVGGTVFILLALALVIVLRRSRSRDFVHFHELPRPDVTPQPMDAQDKVPVHATGFFEVEGKQQRHTWLPGYYRTFATREHALLCLVQERQFMRISRRLADETGMWYVFFRGNVIQSVRWGELHFGNQPRQAIAVDYQVTVPPKNRFQRERTITETIYMAVQDQEHGLRILADLLHDAAAS